jgi:hypothetical protein
MWNWMHFVAILICVLALATKLICFIVIASKSKYTSVKLLKKNVTHFSVDSWATDM